VGIYPTVTTSRPGNRTYTTAVETPGLKVTYVYELICVVEERTDCFCCSCSDEESTNDPYCRNHGWAAKRPCDIHDMPGDLRDDFDEPITPVQAYRDNNYREL
jgi:hypothetical protein